MHKIRNCNNFTKSVTISAVTKEQAEKTARAAFGLGEEWKLSRIEYHQGGYVIDGVENSWQLMFDKGQSMGMEGSSVTVDAKSGQIVSYNRYGKGAGATGSFTQSEAQAIAEQFAKKLAPDRTGMSELIDSTIDGYQATSKIYSFTYQRRTADGVYVLGDDMNITVATDGTVMNFTTHWTNGALPEPAGALTADAANKAYRDSLDLHLFYNASPKSANDVKLIYSPNYSPMSMSYWSDVSVLPMFDAKTGKTIGMDGKERNPSAFNTTPLVPGGPLAPTVRSTPMTQEEAEAAVKALGLLKDGDKIVQSSFSDDNNSHKFWNLGITRQGTQYNDIAGNITIDALTGEVNSFALFSERQPVPAAEAISDDAAKKIAVELVKKMFPSRTGSLILVDRPSPASPEKTELMKNISFALLKNGIPTTIGLDVQLDAKGNLQGLYASMGMLDQSQLTFPDPSNVIDADKAKEIYVSKRPLRLSYLFPVTEDGQRSKDPILVYAPKQERSVWVINAQTGEWFNTSPWSQPVVPVMPSDINGHWAEKSLTQFAEMGLLELTDGKANPDATLTRAQFVRLLADAGTPPNIADEPTFRDVPKDHKYFKQIEWAVSQGWIAKDAEFHPNAPITREEAAAIFSRILGYGEIVKHPDIFTLKFNDRDDVADWAKGSVAILSGLGVMSGYNNQFHPHGQITLAEEVTAISKLNGFRNTFPVYK